jgi:hypothetical protein
MRRDTVDFSSRISCRASATRTAALRRCLGVDLPESDPLPPFDPARRHRQLPKAKQTLR